MRRFFGGVNENFLILKFGMSEDGGLMGCGSQVSYSLFLPLLPSPFLHPHPKKPSPFLFFVSHLPPPGWIYSIMGN